MIPGVSSRQLPGKVIFSEKRIGAGRENEKGMKQTRPLPGQDRGRAGKNTDYSDRQSAAAASGAAGTRAAATAANRVGGGDGETGTVPGLDKIYLDGTTGGEQSFFHQKADTIFFKSLIVVFWLVQSQSQ